MQIAAIRVPIRNKAFIEREAERLLGGYLAETGSRIEGAIPVEDIAQYHLCLRLGFADLHEVLDLPRGGGGPDILGALFFEQRAILINDRLNPEVYPEQLGRYRFSLVIKMFRANSNASVRRWVGWPSPTFRLRM